MVVITSSKVSGGCLSCLGECSWQLITVRTVWRVVSVGHTQSSHGSLGVKRLNFGTRGEIEKWRSSEALPSGGELPASGEAVRSQPANVVLVSPSHQKLLRTSGFQFNIRFAVVRTSYVQPVRRRTPNQS